jgi:hypothetical protein
MNIHVRSTAICAAVLASLAARHSEAAAIHPGLECVLVNPSGLVTTSSWYNATTLMNWGSATVLAECPIELVWNTMVGTDWQIAVGPSGWATTSSCHMCLAGWGQGPTCSYATTIDRHSGYDVLHFGTFSTMNSAAAYYCSLPVNAVIYNYITG